MTYKLIVLNFNSGEVDIYSITDDQADNVEDVITEALGLNLDEVQYMTTPELKINIH